VRKNYQTFQDKSENIIIKNALLIRKIRRAFSNRAAVKLVE
jgi:hypothetical protein